MVVLIEFVTPYSVGLTVNGSIGGSGLAAIDFSFGVKLNAIGMMI